MCCLPGGVLPTKGVLPIGAVCCLLGDVLPTKGMLPIGGCAAY